MSDLKHLYQQLTDRDCATSLSADDVVALARGRSVDDHDAKLARLAQSTADAQIVRFAQALAPASRELAAAIEAMESPARKPAARVPVGLWRWAGVAASILAVAVLIGVQRGGQSELSNVVMPTNAVSGADAPGSDEILNVSFEESAALAARRAAPGGDDIFTGEFDS
jgi:hypothetical protein